MKAKLRAALRASYAQLEELERLVEELDDAAGPAPAFEARPPAPLRLLNRQQGQLPVHCRLPNRPQTERLIGYADADLIPVAAAVGCGVRSADIVNAKRAKRDGEPCFVVIAFAYQFEGGSFARALPING